MTSTTRTDQLVLRPATAADATTLRDLAALESRPLPAGPHLVAVVGGELQAAVSLTDGTAVADPFRPTAALVELLQVHAAAEAPAPARRRTRLRLRPRFAQVA